jgi:lipopolysaccharide export system permease protein
MRTPTRNSAGANQARRGPTPLSQSRPIGYDEPHPLPPRGDYQFDEVPLARLDRYLLAQLMGLFGFFALVLVSVYWLNRAVQLFEQLISDGQSALVVLEFTALTLPYVIRVVLPIAAFAATLYAINKLSSESELVVMQATGASPWRLARAVLVFGAIVGAMMMILVNVLEPVARATLAERQAEIAENITAQFLNDGAFMHPAKGVTLYIREISSRGELLDFFLSDARNTSETIYTAERALVVKSDQGPKLLMFSGQAQIRSADGRLTITRFDDFTYDIGALVPSVAASALGLREMTTWQLLTGAADGLDAGARTAELHTRLAAPLLALSAVFIGFATLMTASFSRFGIWRQIVLAIGLLILVQFIANWAEAQVIAKPALWALSYLPSLAGMAIAAGLLAHSVRARNPKRNREDLGGARA